MSRLGGVEEVVRSWLQMVPPRFAKFYGALHDQAFTLLDVGCGNHSATIAKRWFPKCRYFGIDKGVYANNDADFRLMEQFYQIDLSRDSSLAEVPDAFFDVVVFNHVIEHLVCGLDVLAALTEKIKPGGRIYVEFPAVRSLSFPSMKGTLNFCDDETHVRVYDIKEVANVLLARNFKVIRAGTRRTWWNLMVLPVYLVGAACTGKWLSVLWEVLGFAEYVYAVKRPAPAAEARPA